MFSDITSERVETCAILPNTYYAEKPADPI